MIIKIEFNYEMDTEFMICPSKIGRNIIQLKREFDKWLYNGENDHPYWVIAYEDGDGNKCYGVSFNADAFVYWLNHVRFKKGKRVARLIKVPNRLPKKTIRF
jgi:hypothetical protein